MEDHDYVMLKSLVLIQEINEDLNLGVSSGK